MSELLIETDRRTNVVILHDGAGFLRVELEHHQALDLSGALQRAAERIEPPRPVGRTYVTVGG